MSEQPKVIIRCCVYNHEPYLRDCLEGFVMQQTNFPFKAVVHDDCSTDNSAAIIREYAEKYPHIIEPIYETENQYSKKDGSLRRIMDEATLNRSPYIAYCEGDDYWIDPYKLQKQVDYMEAHPECAMTCSNVEIITSKGFITDIEKKRAEYFHQDFDKVLTVEEIITCSGPTCTLLIRSELFDYYPTACKRCAVGDYPLQIYAALNGSVYCFSRKTSVYRHQTPSSFTKNYPKFTPQRKSRIIKSIINMLDALNQYSNYSYDYTFKKIIYHYLIKGATKDHTFNFRLYASIRAMKIYPKQTFFYFAHIVKAKLISYFKNSHNK